MAANLYLLGDRPFANPFVGLSDEFTVLDGGWLSQEQYPRQLADVNGDGRADIVGFASDGVYVSLANSNGTFAPIQVGLPFEFSSNATWQSQNINPRQLADVNGDGRADIVGFANDAVLVSLANSDGTFANPFVGLSDNFTVLDGVWSNQTVFPRQLADVNGDGRADIVGFGENAVLVSLANSNGTFAPTQVGLPFEFSFNATWQSQNINPRQLADVNGDGRADIVGFANDAVLVSLANSDGTFANPFVGLSGEFTVLGGGWLSQEQYPRQLADVNGDGRADIVGFASDGVYVSLANSNGTFASIQVGLYNEFSFNATWQSQNINPRQLADINGDGRADIVGFANDAVLVSLETTNKNDLLVGGEGNDTIDGLTGNDTLYGQGGNDWLYGRDGIDSLDGDSGNDRLYGGTGNDTLKGDSGNDILNGEAGVDNIEGGNGNDTLTGGGGNDILNGGAGKDYFKFNSFNDKRDTINGFSVVDDTIQVSAGGFGGGLVAGAAITAAQFRIGSAAGDSSDRFIYNNSNGALFFDRDGNGGGFAQVQIASLSSGLAMTNSDIFVMA